MDIDKTKSEVITDGQVHRLLRLAMADTLVAQTNMSVLIESFSKSRITLIEGNGATSVLQDILGDLVKHFGALLFLLAAGDKGDVQFIEAGQKAAEKSYKGETAEPEKRADEPKPTEPEVKTEGTPLIIPDSKIVTSGNTILKG
jgi:hypothetical protein